MPADEKQSKQFLEERRLVAQGRQLNGGVSGAGLVSGLVLGIGTYARWLGDPAPDWANIALGLGLAGAVYFAWQLSREGVAVRVGDAGVAVEQGNELQRLLWCEMESISVEKDQLQLRGSGPVLSIPVTAHATAVAWILKEAAERLPKLLDVPPKFVDTLPQPQTTDGAVNHVTSLQTTGRRCAKSRKVIKYERDARLCPMCTQVYLKDQIPEICVTCNHTLGPKSVVP